MVQMCGNKQILECKLTFNRARECVEGNSREPRTESVVRDSMEETMRVLFLLSLEDLIYVLINVV